MTTQANEQLEYEWARKPDELQSVFAQKAATDPGYAVAYALLRLVEAQRHLTAELERFGRRGGPDSAVFRPGRGY